MHPYGCWRRGAECFHTTHRLLLCVFLALGSQVQVCSHGVLVVMDLQLGVNPATRGWW